MEAEMLARIQFGFTSGFHYIYPPMSIGIGLMLCVFEGIYLKTKDQRYKQIAMFWTRIFALTFAVGVATGLVQLFSFGTNWARYSRFVGDVFGSALGAEAIFAFFLESGFLGLMLFGWNRVSPRLHYISTLCVAFGAHFSSIWIVVANSWMQTPAGYSLVKEGGVSKAVVTHFWEMVFNPSSVDRLTHVILGCWLVGIFLIMSVTAYYVLKRKHLAFSEKTFKVIFPAAAIVLLLQLISADQTARGVAVNQPPKLAAMEGIYTTAPYTPLTLVGWVDTKTQQTKGLKIPGALSFLTYRNFETPVKGFDQIPEDERPPIGIVFQTYHLMILMWVLMVFVVACSFYLWKKGKLAKAKWILWAMMFSVAFPQIGNLTGWMTAEIGRQPWVVYGLLRTADATSLNVNARQIALSLGMFVVIYSLLLILFITLLDQKIKEGPKEEEESTLYRDLL